MLRNMVTSLLKHERIHTTDTRAKVLRGWVDHLVTLARRGDLHARRQALAIVQEDAVVHKLFADAKERFTAFSKGGYTRIVKLGNRAGDAAPMSLIELVGAPGVTEPSGGKKAKANKKEATTVVTASAATAAPAAAATPEATTEPAVEGVDVPAAPVAAEEEPKKEGE
jgi:large subunit ribosomal protein L17